jgi:hypothetical protein
MNWFYVWASLKSSSSSSFFEIRINGSSKGCQMAYFWTKIPIWVNFGGSYDGRCRYILWTFGLHILRTFGILCGTFGLFSHVWVKEKSGSPGSNPSFAFVCFWRHFFAFMFCRAHSERRIWGGVATRSISVRRNMFHFPCVFVRFRRSFFPLSYLGSMLGII